MKKQMKTILISAILMACVVMFIAGCVVPNPNYDSTKPADPTNNPPKLVDPRLPQTSNTVATVGTALAPVNPYAGITDLAIKGIFGLIGAVSAYLVTRGQVTTQQNALAQLAASVVAQGPAITQAITDHASFNEANYPVVADALNRKDVGTTATPTVKTT